MSAVAAADFVGTEFAGEVDDKGYFRRDFSPELEGSREQWTEYCDVQESFRTLGYELREHYSEHDCLTGTVVKLKADMTIDPSSINLEALRQDACNSALRKINASETLTTALIARACYDANGEYCKLAGDADPLPWDQCSASTEEGVLFRIKNPDAPNSALHENWLKSKAADGWKWGEVKNVETKEHPAFLPYDKLPETQRLKDELFTRVVMFLVRYLDPAQLANIRSTGTAPVSEIAYEGDGFDGDPALAFSQADAIVASVVAGLPSHRVLTVGDLPKAFYDACSLFYTSLGDTAQLAYVGGVVDNCTARVMYALGGDYESAQAQHEDVVSMMLEEGWRFSTERGIDAVAMVSPYLCPWGDLPLRRKVEETILFDVIKALKPVLVGQKAPEPASIAGLTNLYKGGQGDARQSDSPVLDPECSLFRKRYRKLSEPEVALHDAIKDKADELYRLFMQVSPIDKGQDANRERGANVQLGVRHLEDAVYRVVKGLTS